jgi:3-dehydroquinate dehydratase-1
MFKETPMIALSITDKDLENTLNNAKLNCIDIIELRIDQFENKELNHVKEVANKVKSYDFYTIATVRSKIEGGSDIPDSERLKIFYAVIDFVDIVDIEYTSTNIKEKVKEIAKNKGKLLLMSYHDFEKTPSENEIQKLIDDCKAQGADIVKYAFKANTFEDVARVMCITNKNKDKNIVAISMGEIGKITRVAGFMFGSLITYTYIGQSFAPGQIEVKKLNELIEFFKGG